MPLFLEIDKYDKPTLVKNPNLSFISFKTCFEIASSCSFNTWFKLKNHSLASSIVRRDTSAMSCSLILTHRVSNFNLLPLHFSQSLSDWYLPSSSLTHLLSLSFNLLIKFGIIPSKALFDLKTLVPSL